MKRKNYTLTVLVIILTLCGCGMGAAERDVRIKQEAGVNAGFYRTETERYTLDALPEYEGRPYAELNGNLPDFSDEEKRSREAFEIYSELDELGRCGTAYANICPELMPTQERGRIGQIRPSGWHTVKYNELIADNYLYNRCHLIGYQLAGENANEKNLITGTRYLNVEGMLPFENQVDDYVEETGNHVLYRVTPIFEGEDLVASGVEMEAWSVEDQGVGVCFHVYCYNVQPGIEIDYADGGSREAAASGEKAAQSGPAGQEGKANADEEGAIREFLLNTNTKRFHLPECSSVKDIKEQNKKAYTGTVSELKEQGYTPCARCLAGYK